MNDKERGQFLVNNLKKVIKNLEKRIKLFLTLDNDVEQMEILRESIIQNHEIAIELSWKCARSISLWIEPEGRVSGSTTAIKHALRTGVINSEDTARGLLSAIQGRNKSSHEYLLEKNIESYVQSIIDKYFVIFEEVIIDFERSLLEEK